MANLKKEFSLSSWAIDNRMTVFVIMAIIFIGGIVSYNSMPRESFPEIVESKIYISSVYPGNAAEDVEKLITKELEDELTNITGVDQITSNSFQDYSMIIVQFEEDITPEEAKSKVQDKVDIVKATEDWPTLDAGGKVDPYVFDLNISEAMPIMNINLTGDYSSQQLKEYAEYLQEKIEELPEIKEASIRGVQDKEVEVAVDLYKMTAARVSINQVVQAIQKENITISGGDIINNDVRRNIRVIGEIERPEDLNNFVVKADNGVVYIQDIATIKFREKDRTTYARESMSPVVMLDVTKKAGRNMIEAREKIDVIVEEARAVELPSNLNISITNDQSERVIAQVNELENSIILGVLLVVGVLMFFLGVRNAAFVGIAIPLSMLMSFLLLPQLGAALGMNVTLNTMVLFASVMGLGMLVDNGIVVVENVYRLMDEGYSKIEAAKQGVGEIAWPIIASTATTLAAFLPLGFWSGTIGKFMIYLPLTLSTVLGSSLFVALVINSMLTSRFMEIDEKPMTKDRLIKISGGLIILGGVLTISGLLKTNIVVNFLGGLFTITGLIMTVYGWYNRNKTAMMKQGFGILAVGILYLVIGQTGSFKAYFGFGNLMLVVAAILWIHRYALLPVADKFQNKWLPALENWYEEFLKKALRKNNAYYYFIGSIVLLIFSFVLLGVSNIKTEFFPDNQPNQAIIYVEYPMGTDIEKTKILTESIEERVLDLLKTYEVNQDGSPYNYMIESVISQVGEGSGNFMVDGPSENETPHKGKVTVSFREFKYRRGISSSDVLTEIRETVGGYPGVSVIVEKDQNGPPPGYAINLELKGENYDELLSFAEDIRDEINGAQIAGIEELKVDVSRNKPEMEIYVDREKSGKLGVSTQQVGFALRQAIYGIDASTYKDDKDDYDIVVRFDENSRYNESSLLNQFITFRDQNSGQLKKVPISSVVTTRKTTTFSSIKRKDLKRVITIYSNVLEGYNATEIVQKIEDRMAKKKLPTGVSYKFTGEQEEIEKNMSFLSTALIIALALISIIIVAQFNSITKPVIILSAVILSFIGVLLGTVISGMNFVVIMTMLGIISLAGIVVNNAIVLIDYTQLIIDSKKAEQGLGADDLLTREEYFNAIVAGGKSRLRPVLLTAITTILGLIPLAIGLNIDFFSLFTEFDPKFYVGGDNTIFWGPMSYTIIYGLTFATFLTLVIVPVMFYLLNRAKIRLAS
ncbi:efflux RND transporter permease subunit [Flavobacteriaceae bacterium]|nr:efflux RND transporter permease subunit [Flavobacteriaceae bacterium]